MCPGNKFNKSFKANLNRFSHETHLFNNHQSKNYINHEKSWGDTALLGCGGNTMRKEELYLYEEEEDDNYDDSDGGDDDDDDSDDEDGGDDDSDYE